VTTPPKYLFHAGGVDFRRRVKHRGSDVGALHRDRVDSVKVKLDFDDATHFELE
jgi:hypothetical protein